MYIADAIRLTYSQRPDFPSCLLRLREERQGWTPCIKYSTWAPLVVTVSTRGLKIINQGAKHFLKKGNQMAQEIEKVTTLLDVCQVQHLILVIYSKQSLI